MSQEENYYQKYQGETLITAVLTVPRPDKTSDQLQAQTKLELHF